MIQPTLVWIIKTPIFPELHNQRELVRAWWKSISRKTGRELALFL
jgi:hypothetical protein